MFKKDDKVKVIKGIKAFEGLTGTVLDTNGSQVKVKLNMSEDAEVQKNIINIFEDYQLELESLDLLKEEAEATFEDEEDEEETPEEIEKKLVEYEQMVQNAIRKRKPVEWGELKLYFANERDDNPDIKYETQVFYENGYPQKWDTPDWDSFDGWDYTLKLNFEELLGIAREVEDPFACLKKAGIYNDPEATGLLARDVLFVLDHLDDRVFDKLNEKAQQEYDEQGGHSRYDESLNSLKEDVEVAFEDEEDEDKSEPTEEAKKELVKYKQMVQDAVKSRKPVKFGSFKVYFKDMDSYNPEIEYEGLAWYENGYKQDWDTPEWDCYDETTYSMKIDFEELMDIASGYTHPLDCLKKANIYKDPYAEDEFNPEEILYVLNHLNDEAYDRLDKKLQQVYDEDHERDYYDYYDESLDSLKEDVEVAFDNDENEKQVCCICGEEYTGYGNNAEPYKEGRCCDKCNRKFVIPSRLNKLRSAKNESLKLTEEELKNWCSDNDANYYTQDIKNDKVIIRGLKEDLAEYDFKTKELKVFDYSGTTTQEQDLEDDYDDNYIRDYVYDVDMLDDEEYPSWEFVSVIATAENISDDSVIQEAHDRGFKVFLIQASNYEKFVVAAEKITEDDIMEDFASYLEGNPKVTEII